MICMMKAAVYLRVCENIFRSPALAAGEVVLGVIAAARIAL
jgi:hypothetical protein